MAEKGAAEEQQLLRDLGSEIPVQFQGWILVFATITGIWLLCLPCFCAGQSCACARKCGSKMLEQLPIFLLLAVALEAGVLVLLISWLPDWTLSDYVKALARFLSMVLTLLQLAPSVVMIVAACVVVSFKDRILMMLGLDHKALFRWKLFDCCCCFGGSRYRAVELSIWKLTELETGVFSGNNVFVEVSLGFNESMRTRVHNNAGTDCLMKETLQMNFDENDDDETLYIFVRSQKQRRLKMLCPSPEVPFQEGMVVPRHGAGPQPRVPARQHRCRSRKLCSSFALLAVTCVVASGAALGVASAFLSIVVGTGGQQRPLRHSSRMCGSRKSQERCLVLARASTVGAEQPEDLSPMELAGRWWNETYAFWDAFEVWSMPIEEDPAPEAVALYEQNEKIEKMRVEQEEIVSKKSYLRGRADQDLGEELNKVPDLLIEYYKMKFYRILSKDVVKKGFVSFLTYANVLFIIVFLRTVVPRLIVATSLDDFYSLANELGIPSQESLAEGLQAIGEYDLLPKVGFYTLAFIAEKVTLLSEILPIQVGLKTIAPLIFGGLIPGALISASCETVGALVNFLIGRAAFTQRLRDLEFFGEPPLGTAPWFGRLEKAAEKDGFKIVLLLRLAHILPLPFDSYWYILGALPVGPLEFIAAHWLGCLKTAFLDASLGVLLLSSVGVQDSGQTQQVVIAETLAFALVALLIQTTAVALVKDILGLVDESAEEKSKKTTDNEVRPSPSPSPAGAAPAAAAPDAEARLSPSPEGAEASAGATPDAAAAAAAPAAQEAKAAAAPGSAAAAPAAKAKVTTPQQ